MPSHQCLELELMNIETLQLRDITKQKKTHVHQLSLVELSWIIFHLDSLLVLC